MSSIHFERAQDVCRRKDCVDQIFRQLHMLLFFPPKRLRAALLPLKKHPIPAPTLGQCRTQQADLRALAEVQQVHQVHLPLMQQLRVLESLLSDFLFSLILKITCGIPLFSKLAHRDTLLHFDCINHLLPSVREERLPCCRVRLDNAALVAHISEIESTSFFPLRK